VVTRAGQGGQRTTSKDKCLGWGESVLGRAGGGESALGRAGGGESALGRAGLRAVAVAAAALMLGGCGLLSGPTSPQQDDPLKMTVTSSEFGPQTPIPHQYTCFTRHPQTPPLSWTGAPPGTKSLALVMDDGSAISGAPTTPYVYWIVFNISPATPDIQAGRPPPGALQADNSKGTVGYIPPCPAYSHQYRFTIYALNAQLPLQNGASLTAAWSAIAAHAIGRGRLPVTVNP
jgi:Raf kinase inhibitor-like YbhB/YbcL family protein